MKKLVDDFHLMADIVACTSCGQQFALTFLEYVDYAHGDDAQYHTLLPLTTLEAAVLCSKTEPGAIVALNALDQTRKALMHDWPQGEPDRTAWGAGMWLI